MRDIIKGKMIEDCIDELKTRAVLKGSKAAMLVKGSVLVKEILNEEDPQLRKAKKMQLDMLLKGAEIMHWAFPKW